MRRKRGEEREEMIQMRDHKKRGEQREKRVGRIGIQRSSDRPCAPVYRSAVSVHHLALHPPLFHQPSFFILPSNHPPHTLRKLSLSVSWSCPLSALLILVMYLPPSPPKKHPLPAGHRTPRTFCFRGFCTAHILRRTNGRVYTKYDCRSA